jgi:large subunit ribosomal protein L23
VQIRQAIEAAFGVKVLDVRTLRVRGKYRRFGARSGLGSEWKKAYVRVADGQTPNFQ